MKKRSRSANKSTSASKRALKQGGMESGSEYGKTSAGKTSRDKSSSYGAGKTTSRQKNYE